MRVLVTGADGFIGGFIVAALRAAGHDVLRAVRAPARGNDAIAVDLARDTSVEHWRARVAGVDAVVNVAGILRESGEVTFAAVHEQAPLALFHAAQEAGARRVVQVSALGDVRDAEFVASKHRLDTRMPELAIDWVVLRPSVVYATRGSHGGSSLLRAMAAFPGLLPVPGDGTQQLQPIAAEDVARAVVAALERREPVGQVIELVGPHIVTLREYLAAWRHWLGFAPARVLRVPLALVALGAALGEYFSRGPLGRTTARMLARGNVAAPAASGRQRELLGLEPRALAHVLAAVPAQTQDRWHARLYLLAPVLRIALALVWIASGLVGLLTPIDEVFALTADTGWPGGLVLAFAYGGSVVDIALGVPLLLGRAVRPVLVLMFLSVVAYTLAIGCAMPAVWLDPFGSLLKNFVVLPTLLVMWVLAGKR